MDESQGGADRADEAGGWLVSLAFWLCLLTAACLYAVVALAPRYLTWRQLDARHYASQVRLVTLEHEVERLARIADALASEPAYATERARIDFRAPPRHAEQIPVALPLQLSEAAAVHPSHTTIRVPPHALLLEPFAWQRPVRRGTLAAAALLTVFAFAFLHDGHTEQARSLARGLNSALGRLLARYRGQRAG